MLKDELDISRPNKKPKYEEPVLCLDEISERVWKWELDVEKQMQPKPNRYFIKDTYRRVIIDWIFKVSAVNNYSRETVHKAICIFNQYISVNECLQSKNYQLIIICCLTIAVKYEDVKVLTLDKCKILCDNTYKMKEIKDMEVDILKTLNYRLSGTTVNYWVSFFMKNAAIYKKKQTYDPVSYFVVMNWIDNAVHFDKSIEFMPSIIAASALLVIETNNINKHNIELLTRYSAKELEKCSLWLRSLIAIPRVLEPTTGTKINSETSIVQTHNPLLLKYLQTH